MGVDRYDELGLVAELASELGVGARGRPVRRVDWEGDGHRISGLRWGDREPAVVLLHGGSLNAHSWDAMLLLHDLPALALDLPGHGQSSWWADPLYLPAALAAAVAPVIAEGTGGPVAVVGHSLGGLAALALAAERPDLVAALVVVDATPGSTPERSKEILDFVAETEFESFDAVVAHAATFRRGRSRNGLHRAVLHNVRQREDGRWTWRHDSRRLARRDRWDLMFAELPKGWAHAAAVRSPMLLVRGARSRILLDDDVARYRELVADLEVEEVTGAGHNVHGDQPDALGAVIGRFLAAKGVLP